MGSRVASTLRPAVVQKSAFAVLGAVAAAAVTLIPAAAGVTATTSPTTSSPPFVIPGPSFAAPGVLATGQHTVVLTQRSGAQATLLVGANGATPTAAPGAGSLPSWARPHVGTDAQRRRVIVYPRCTTADVRSCDLYEYGIDAATERRASKVNRASVGEVEGAMEKGAIAFTRWTRAKQPLDFDHGATTTLLYRPVSGPTRLVTRKGGQQIALHDTRIVLVRDTDPSYGVCGRPSVQLLRLDGTRRLLRGYRCGMDAHRPVSPTFLGDRIVWAMLSVSEVVFSQWNARVEKVATQRVAMAAPEAYAPVTWDRALVLTPQYSTTSLTFTLVSVWDMTPPGAFRVDG